MRSSTGTSTTSQSAYYGWAAFRDPASGVWQVNPYTCGATLTQTTVTPGSAWHTYCIAGHGTHIALRIGGVPLLAATSNAWPLVVLSIYGRLASASPSAASK